MSGWLLFLYALPTGRSSQRVGLWRNLKKLGALPLKTSAYLLPDTPAHYERFQWLAQRLREDGGEATLIRADRIEGLPDSQICALFNEQRAADYAEVTNELAPLLKRLRRKGADAAAPGLEKLRAWFEEIHQIDFFDCPKKQDVLMLFRKVERGRPLIEPRPRRVRKSDYRGRVWLTRPRPEIDRVGSAWLIKNFIDPGARFVFGAKAAGFPDAVPYDMLDVEFSHHGDDCTFETLLRCFGLADKTLRRLGEMIHQADLHDGKFARVEAEGLDRILKGLGRLGWLDEKILEHGFACFDALYAQLNTALSPTLLPGASPGDFMRGSHSPAAAAGLAGRRPNISQETLQRAVGNVPAFKS